MLKCEVEPFIIIIIIIFKLKCGPFMSWGHYFYVKLPQFLVLPIYGPSIKGKSQRTVMLDSYQITSLSVANNAAYDLFTGLRWEYTTKIWRK